MFTKCCGCTKKVSKTKTNDNLTNESTYTKQPSLRKSDTNTDLNHTDTDSKDNASTKPVTPVLLLPSDDNSPTTMPEIVSSTNNKSSSGSSTRQDATEIKIEDVCDTNSISDDDVFQEGVGAPIQLAANLATPYPLKKGSIPGLPRWFSEEDDQETGGTQEPPATPVGKDELALRRHRFFSELMTAAQAAAEHRVRFDPLGPVVAGGEKYRSQTHFISLFEHTDSSQFNSNIEYRENSCIVPCTNILVSFYRSYNVFMSDFVRQNTSNRIIISSNISAPA